MTDTNTVKTKGNLARLALTLTLAALVPLASGQTALAAKRFVGVVGLGGGIQGGQIDAAVTEDEGAVTVNSSGAGGVPVGTIYVAEGGNRRVQQFDPSGQFVRAWGIGVITDDSSEFEICENASQCGTGTGPQDNGAIVSQPGAIARPRGIAVDQSTGNLYVVNDEPGFNRIAIFSATGQLQGAFGRGVVDGSPEPQFCVSNCHATVGNSPFYGIAVSPDGFLYVANRNQRRVDVYQPTLAGATVTGIAFVRGFGWDVSPDGAPGDTAADEFEICTTACQPAPEDEAPTEAGHFSYGPQEGSPQLLSNPTSVVVDSTGAVYALDRGVRRNEQQEVAVNATSGTFTLSFEGATTAPLAHDASEPAIEAALEALPTIGVGNLNGFPMGFVFTGALGHADVPQVTCDAAGLSGGTCATVTHKQGLFTPPRIHTFDPSGAPLDTDASFGGDALVDAFGADPDPRRLAIDPDTDHLLIAGGAFGSEAPRVLELDPSGDQVDLHGPDLPALTLNGVLGLAASPLAAGGNLYLLSRFRIDVLAENPPVIDPLGSCATTTNLTGTVSSDGQPLTYHFEYVGEADFQQDGWESATRVPAADVGAGPAPGGIAVEQDVSDLSGSQAYRFRLIATKNGVTRASNEVACTTDPAPPAVSAAGVVVDETGALLQARINPENEETSYHFEYTTQADFDANGWANTLRAPELEEAPAGEGGKAALVAQEVSGLQGGTAYRSRLLAANATGQSTGAEQAFTTLIPNQDPDPGNCPNEAFRSGPSANLPDCRAYELVSPPGAPNILNEDSFASPDGQSVSYPSFNAFASAPQNTYNHYLSHRGPAGWVTALIDPPFTLDHTKPLINLAVQEPKGFSEDFSRVYLATEVNADPADTNQTADLYLREPDGSYSWVSEPPAEPSIDFAGNSADGSHAVFLGKDDNAYEAIDGGTPALVNLLPSGGVAAQARVGDYRPNSGDGGNALGSVSVDGRRIFFESDAGPASVADPATTKLWVREEGMVTRPIVDDDEAANLGIFAAASRDGSLVFFTTSVALATGDTNGDPDLYRYHLDADVYQRLSPDARGGDPDPRVRRNRGVVVSEGGGRVYFVAKGVLTPEPNANGQSATAGIDNIYLWNQGDIRFVASPQSGSGPNPALAVAGPAGSVIERPAGPEWDLSGDGTHLAFSTQDALLGGDTDSSVDIYVYDLATGLLRLGTIGPSGGGGDFPATPSRGQSRLIAHTPRFLSDDGRFLFFQTKEGLLDRDLNSTTDVYERDLQAERTWLLSSGASSARAELIGIGRDGKDVFFIDPRPLTPQDVDGEPSVYDARIGGGFAARVSPSCVGDACKGAPNSLSPQPPASSRFSGPGNLKPKPSKRRCTKGKRRVTRRGKVRCVKQQRKAKRHRPRGHERRARP